VRLILGLGNPGAEYEGTRHNVGFAVVETLAARHRVSLARSRRVRVGAGRILGQSVVLALPQTFMNLVGEAARPLAGQHGLTPAEIIVVHDEADFPPGLVRIKAGGGTAGHRGLASLVEHLGSADFVRVRVGIGRPGDLREELEDYVLERPTPEEAEALAEGILRAADAVEILVRDGLQAAMRAIHRTE